MNTSMNPFLTSSEPFGRACSQEVDAFTRPPWASWSRTRTLLPWVAILSLALWNTGVAFADGLPVTNGLSLRLSADFGVTTNSDGLVSAWTDSSGAGHSGTQPSPASQPVLLLNQLNGLPVLHFTGNQFFS